jgi:hypothetical protein
MKLTQWSTSGKAKRLEEMKPTPWSPSGKAKSRVEMKPTPWSRVEKLTVLQLVMLRFNPI